MVCALVGIAAAFVFIHYDPSHSALFPKCPVYMATGLKCPGCGSQRTVHFILSGDFLAAWRMNGLLVVSIPYIIFGVIAQGLQKHSMAFRWIRTRLYGVIAAWIVLAVIVCFTVLRNIL
jgi:hypothetical protein